MDTKHKLNYLFAIAAVLGGATVASQAQIQTAGTLLVDVNATTSPLGSLSAITNNGTMGGWFSVNTGGAGATPVVATAFGNGTKGIFLDGGDYLQHVADDGAGAPSGTVVSADPTLTGVNPTYSVEVWAVNPGIAQEETMVAWGHRGGGDGQNMSFNYGWDDRFGAMGHWGSPDMGWDPCCGSGSNPPLTPKSGVWHHLVYTYDGATQKVYSDGVLLNSEPIGLNIYPVPGILIGAQYDNDTVVTGGLRGRMMISQVRVHSEALTAGQVANNYNFERGGYDNNLGSAIPFHPTHRYSFNNAAGAASDGAVVLDSEGTAHGNIRGGGATFTGSRVTLPGGSSTTQGYIDLPNGLLSANSTNNGGLGEVTLEGWVKVTGNQNWARIFDIGSSAFGEVPGAGGGGEGTDYIFLSAQEGGNVNRHVIDIRNIDGAPTSDPGGPAYDSGNFNRDFHFALSWNEATGEIIVYENGAPVDGFSAAGTAISHINDVNVWLGRSQWNGDNNLQGEFDEFRIWNRVLTPAQLRASYLAGANALATADPASITLNPQSVSVPEFGGATFTAAAQGALPVTLRWYLNGTFTGAVGNSISYSEFLLIDSGAQIYAVASNNIAGTSYFATSQVAIVTVIADTNAPTVTSARVNATNLVEVFFNEPVKAVDLAVTGNFSISGLNAPLVLGAAPGANNRSAILTIDRNLTDCEFYVVTVTGVRDVSAAANVVTAPNNTATIFNYSATGLTHRYNFNQVAADATGVAAIDSVGGADGVIRNAGGVTSLTGDKVTLSGGSGSFAPYVDLPNGLVSGNSTNNAGSGQLTFEGWVKVTGVQSWSRIFDFGATDIGGFVGGEVFGPGAGNQGIDYLFYSAMNGTDPNTRRIDRSNRDEADFGTIGADFGVANFNQQFHFAVTWDETTGQIRVYEDGVQRASVTTAASMSSLNDVNVWLGRSVWTVDSNLQGEFNEFRTYNKVLSVAEIQINKAAGPDANLGNLTAMTFVAGTNTSGTNSMVTNTVANATLMGAFSQAGLVNITALRCVEYSSTDSNVCFITPDGVVHAVNPGTATLSAKLNGITETEVIEVTQDATPPTLVSARALSRQVIEIRYSEPVDPGTAEEPSNYQVSGPSGPLDVDSVLQQADQSRVLVTLLQPMPCEWITVLVSFVADQSPLFNTIAENSPVSFLHYAPAGLQHRYSFNNAPGAAPDTSTVLDAVGGANAQVRGAGANFNGDKVVLPGGSSATAAYVDLPNGLLSGNSTNNGGSGKITLEGWVKVTGNYAWSRIFDFGSTGPCCGTGSEITSAGGSGEGIDYLFLSAQQGGNITVRQFEIANRDQAGHGAFVSTYSIANFGQAIHFMVTWDEATGQLRAYEDGVLRASPTTVAAMSEINDVNVWLGRSTWTGDSNLQGEFDDFRVYDRIVSVSEMNVNRAVGPDNAYGQPTGISLSTAASMTYAQTAIPTVTGDFANISGVDMTATRCHTLSSSDSSVIYVDPNGVLHAIGNGTADITAHFSGLSSAPVTVTVTGAPDPLPDPDHVAIIRGTGVNTISFRGTPGTTYRIQRATNLNSPVTWTTIGSQVAAPNGMVVIQDTNPPAGQAFYQAITP